jgi:Cu(I)/Ag(I) efflux system membrane fusion protein
MNKYWPVALIAIAMFASCRNAETESTEAKVPQTQLPAPKNEVVGQDVALLWNNYLKMRDALVAAKSTEAGKWALALHLAAANFPADSLDEEAKLRWTRQQKDLQQDALTINTSDIEGQRAAFESLSKTMYQLITELGLPKGYYVYQQHCPMAFDNRGAWWLSEIPDIVNPYFGDKMLTCGVVKEAFEYN